MELDKEVYPNFYLYEGKEISKKEYNQIKELNNISKFLNYALRIRQKAIYSEFQIREKLYNKSASKKEVDKVIKFMKEYDLIDDNAFAHDCVEYYNSKNFGENKIKRKLSEKGIFQNQIDKLSFPITKERKKAKAILPKFEKKYEKYNYVQKKAHIYNAYLNEGFNESIAKDMVSLLEEASPKEENDKLKKDFDKVYLRHKRKYQGKELKQKTINSLLQKGYRLNDILKLMEAKKI